jgi:hypothetical protein
MIYIYMYNYMPSKIQVGLWHPRAAGMGSILSEIALRPHTDGRNTRYPSVGPTNGSSLITPVSTLYLSTL